MSMFSYYLNYKIKKKMGSLSLIFILGCLHQISFAQTPPNTSASPYATEIPQPDGSTIKILGKGNQQISYSETTDGFTILKNKSGIYEYAVKGRGGRLCPGGTKAKNLSERSQEEQKYLAGLPKNLRYSGRYLKKLEKKRE